MISFSDLVGEIENELTQIYHGEARSYIDRTHENGWTRAIDRFDEAITTYKIGSSELNHEMQPYREAILKYIALYKVFKRGKKIGKFFKKGGNPVSSVQEQQDSTTSEWDSNLKWNGPVQTHLFPLPTRGLPDVE